MYESLSRLEWDNRRFMIAVAGESMESRHLPGPGFKRLD
jgi:hypothetical protein